MTLKEAAEKLHTQCKEIDDHIEVTFTSEHITIYWQMLRMDVQPKDFDKALRVIKDANALEAYFE